MTAEFVRGAQGIADYLNARVVRGRPFNSQAIYRLVRIGRLPVSKRLGGISARTADLDRLLDVDRAA